MLRMVSQADFSTSLTCAAVNDDPPNKIHQPCCDISSPRVGALPTNIQSLAQKCGQSKNEEVKRYKLEHTHSHKPFLQIKMCFSKWIVYKRIRSKCVLTSRKKHPVQCYPSKIGPHQAGLLPHRDVISKAISLFQQQVISMETLTGIILRKKRKKNFGILSEFLDGSSISPSRVEKYKIFETT